MSTIVQFETWPFSAALTYTRAQLINLSASALCSKIISDSCTPLLCPDGGAAARAACTREIALLQEALAVCQLPKACPSNEYAPPCTRHAGDFLDPKTGCCDPPFTEPIKLSGPPIGEPLPPELFSSLCGCGGK